MQARLIYLIPISRSEDIEFIVSRYLHYEHVQYIHVDNWKVDIEVIGNLFSKGSAGIICSFNDCKSGPDIELNAPQGVIIKHYIHRAFFSSLSNIPQRRPYSARVEIIG